MSFGLSFIATHCKEALLDREMLAILQLSLRCHATLVNSFRHSYIFFEQSHRGCMFLSPANMLMTYPLLHNQLSVSFEQRQPAISSTDLFDACNIKPRMIPRCVSFVRQLSFVPFGKKVFQFIVSAECIMLLLTSLGLYILLIARINAISDEMKQMAQSLHDSCVKETGVDEKFIEDCRNGVFAEDDNLKCYMKCLLTRVAMMTEEGNIDVDVIIDMVPDEYKDIAVPVLRACGTAKGSNDCETAFLTNKCWHSKNPENYYLV